MYKYGAVIVTQQWNTSLSHSNGIPSAVHQMPMSHDNKLQITIVMHC